MINYFRTQRNELAAFCLLFFILLQPIAAQNLTGQISGRVQDLTGNIIVGASVQLTNNLTQQVRQAQTDATGVFIFTELLPGNYAVRVEHPGLRSFEQANIEVTAAERVTLPLMTLQVGDVTSTITVQSEAARVQTESSERVGLINRTQVENTPLRGRDYVGLLKLLPGVNDTATRDAPGGGMATVNGGLGGQVVITLDGVVSQDSGATGNTQYQPSVDAIGEMKVLLTNYQAEYGARSGGVVNVVVKSGTPAFSGTVYYYKRNEALNANNFFNNANSVNLGPDGRARRPVYRYDNVGYTLGGPVIIPGTRFNKDRNKLFFFWSHDILSRKNPSAVQRSTFPTQLERQGNFSQSVFGNNGQPVIVKDPTTQVAFPGNIIPVDRINKGGQALLNLLPLPNAVDTTGTRQFNGLYQFVLDQPREDKILRVDYNVGSRTLFYTRLLNGYTNSSGFGAPLSGSGAWPQLNSSYSIRTAGAVGTVIHTFTPRLVNEFTWGINRAFQQVAANDAASLKQNTREGTGLGPTVLPELYPQANPLNLLPSISYAAGSGGGVINNPASVTFENRFPYFGTDTIQNISEGLSWVKDKHNLKFGVYFEHESRNSPDSSSFNGSLNFGSTNLNPLDTGWGYSNAILGVVQQYSQSSTKPVRHSRYSGLEWYAQDNWRVSRRLTLDLGIRFQWTPPSYSLGVPLVAFDSALYNPSLNPPLIQPACLTAARPCSAATGANPPRGLNPATGQLVPAVLIGAFAPGAGTPFQAMRRYDRNILSNPSVGVGPRIGFAYDVFGDGKTAIRGGIGVFYDRGGGTGTTGASNSCCIYISNPPLLTTPAIYYTTLAQLVTAPAYLTPQKVDSTQRDYSLPATFNYSFGVQRNLGLGLLLDVAYVGNTTRHRYVTVNQNQIPYGTTRTASGQLNPAAIDPTTGQPYQANFLRPILGYDTISYGQWSSSSNYNSMQTQLSRRFGSRLQFGATWTWSKVMSYSPAPFVSNIFTYSPDANDRRHNLTVNWTYKVPDFYLAKNLVTKQIFNGWQLTGIATFLSGSPAVVSYGITGAPAGYTITGSPDTASSALPGGLITRIQITGNPILADSARNDKLVSALNPAAFALPAQSAFGIGNSARNFFYGPGISNLDLTLFKEFKLTGERRALQLRGEFYNALNQVVFNNPNTAALFNYSTGAQTNANFGRYTSTRDPRYVVISARLRF